ncbi:peptidylprolyl isomerase [Novosphingobium sp. TCA1]|uniref:peptidylprolyl isomerase n=1 Tax=Novosphingobium sp. TCA1 TaxID=2682474 RepID=UPI0013099088|nr:peptidylprolyl isomerase [Novosphingobium sp. TCA1]GFE76215.1 peptidyl-prolyl cis-trans isomerase [Novosphingobium sp. TCA1]
MRNFFSAFAVSAFLTAPLLAEDVPAGPTPNDIVAAAPSGDWKRIAPSDLLVMDLAPDAAGKARRVVIQLIPAPFSQGWVGNIRRLVAARWYDGIAVVRVQDNYVVQWGDPEGENPQKAKPLPKGLTAVPESDYAANLAGTVKAAGDKSVGHDAYAANTGFVGGWPVARDAAHQWPTHCYGYVGVGRNNSPDTGTGAELYAVIGHAPRQLDRNVAIVGRVISGIENLSALPRGTGEIGFYKTPGERTAIRAIRMGNEVTGLPAYEYLSTESRSFAAYVDKRANRQDTFYVHPAGGVDVCNAPVPIREVSR